MKSYFKNKLQSETTFDLVIFYAWILLEKHYKEVCDCSYCQEANAKNKRFDFWSPPCKARNSWRVLVFDKGDHWKYIRWTLPSFRCIIDFSRWSNGWRLQILNLCGKNSLKGFLTFARSYGKVKLESLFWMEFN